MHPFDLRTVLLAKHAQHVALVHFPIALFIAGVLFDVLWQWTGWQSFADAAYYDLLGAAVTSVPVVITGLIAWQWALEGQRLKGILLLHLLGALASTLMIWIVCFMHWRTRRRDASPAGYRLPLQIAAVLVVGITAHLGGFLSGVNVPS